MSTLLELDARQGVPPGFTELAEEIYGDDPHWIPEERTQLDFLFSERNAFFDRGEGRIFFRPQKIRGATFFDPLAREENKKVAFFGFFESTGDGQEEERLFGAMEAWAREKGATSLVGPIDFGTFGRNRFRLRAIDKGVPFLGEPYNQEAYSGAVERLGYRRCSQAITQISSGEQMSMVWRTRLDRLERLEAEGFRFLALTPELWLSNRAELHGLINRMFAQNYGFAPISERLFLQACGESYIRRTDRECSVIAFSPEGQIGGFFLVYPHWGPLLVAGAGEARVAPGELSFDDHFETLRAKGSLGGVFKTGAVAPEYRRRDLFSALTIWTFRAGEGRYDEWYGALVREDNPSRRYADKVSVDSRWYSLFKRELF